MVVEKRSSHKNEQNYSNLNINRNEFTPIKSAEDDVVKVFLDQKNVAPWFRGTSHFHIKGANKLANALRDDGQQETTHRVRTCLSMIGLKPMIKPKQIMFLMHLCRGNDLVFLWFLMEMHYKTPKDDPNSYSVNEQLICSAICHLDMIPTLRELDKILPRKETSETEMKTSARKRQRLKDLYMKRRNKKPLSNHQYILPYFAKYCRPEHYGKRLFLKEPNFKVNFTHYNRYSDPNYAAPNELNRWYADHRFNSGKRIVHLIIREIITNIFYNFEAASLRSRTTDVLCEYHKTVQMATANLRHESKVKARNECLKCFLSPKKANKDCQLSKPKQNDFMKTITSDCKILDVVGEESGLCNCNTNVIDERVADLGKNHNGKPKTNVLESRFNTRKVKGYESIQNKSNSNQLCSKNSKPPTDKIDRTKEKTINNKENYCSVSHTMETSDAVFTCPTAHKPFQFNYRKIFAPKCTETRDDMKGCIRNMFLAALNEDSIDSSLTDPDQTDLSYDEAVTNCATKIFNNQVKIYELEKRDELETQKAKSSKSTVQFSISGDCNPENYILIDQLLFEAFQHLRKNPKFVLAQLPYAHQLPLLREWLARRFGKEYTPAERARSYRMSYIIFRALDKSNVKFDVPNAKHIGRNLYLNYNCQSQMDKKVQHIKTKYQHILDSYFLEQTRISWFAMRGYICSNGPPRKSYFAYMPSRQQDIHHFRLWKSTEYRNYKVARRSKQRKEIF